MVMLNETSAALPRERRVTPKPQITRNGIARRSCSRSSNRNGIVHRSYSYSWHTLTLQKGPTEKRRLHHE